MLSRSLHILALLTTLPFAVMGTKITINPGLLFWSDVTETRDVWSKSAAFGWLSHAAHPKVYLENHGWWSIGDGSIDGFWAYDHQLEKWLWTSRQAYPNYYDRDQLTWMQFDLADKPAVAATDLTLQRRIPFSPEPLDVNLLNITGKDGFTGFFHSTPNGTAVLNAESTTNSQANRSIGLIKDGVPAITMIFSPNETRFPLYAIVGDYYLNYSAYSDYVRVSISGPGVPANTFVYMPLSAAQAANAAFEMGIIENLEALIEMGVEKSVEGVGLLIKWGWNLIPFMPDGIGLTELENRLRSIRRDYEEMVELVENRLQTRYLEANPGDNVFELSGKDVYDTVMGQPFASDHILIEGQDRLDESVQVERQYDDVLGPITDENGTTVDEEKFLIKGKVLDALVVYGDPVPYQPIYLFAGPDQTTSSNKDGEFVFLVPRGSYSLEARSNDYVFQYSVSQPFEVPSWDSKQITIWRQGYLRPNLMLVDGKAKRRFAAAGQTDFWIDFEIYNDGNGPTDGNEFGSFVISTNYECMAYQNSCSIGIGEPAVPAGIGPGETGWARAQFTIPASYPPGSKVYAMGTIWMPRSYKWSGSTPLPKVQFAICDGTYNGLPSTLPGWALDFTWEQSNDAVVAEGTSTIFNFFSDGGISAYDSDTGQPQLTPSSYTWSSNGATAILEMQFNNNTNGQIITGSSTYFITWEEGCGGTYTGEVNFNVNGTPMQGSGSGFFMLKQVP